MKSTDVWVIMVLNHCELVPAAEHKSQIPVTLGDATQRCGASRGTILWSVRSTASGRRYQVLDAWLEHRRPHVACRNLVERMCYRSQFAVRRVTMTPLRVRTAIGASVRVEDAQVSLATAVGYIQVGGHRHGEIVPPRASLRERHWRAVVSHEQCDRRGWRAA